MRREQWEVAHLFLLTALDKDPSLSQQEDFVQQLTDTARQLGIDDFPQWINGLSNNNFGQQR